MDTPEHHTPSQHFERIFNSAISLSGNATTVNIVGDQHNHYATPQKPGIPPLMLPPRAPFFVGREEDLSWLLRQLEYEGGRILALCGPGGIGKTALAAEALSRLIKQPDWMQRFPDGIFYHSFYSYPSLPVAFEELARLYGEDPAADPYRAALRAMSSRQALLVFDGVEVLESSRLLWELSGQQVVLLLSRRQSDAPDPIHRLTLDLLSHAHGVVLLQQLGGIRAADRQSVEQLVEHVGGYPLALQLIGNYMSSYQEDATDYLDWFENEGLASIHHGKHQTQSVTLLLQRTYDALNTDARSVFLLLGLFAAAPFPLELVQTILDLPERVVRQLLGLLVNLSVLRRCEQGYIQSHPLMHTFASELLLSLESIDTHPLSKTIILWKKRFLDALITHFEECELYDRNGLTLWYPHVLPWLTTHTQDALQSLMIAHLFKVVGAVAFAQGRYVDVEPLFQEALAIQRQQLGEKHSDIAGSLNALAALYLSQGKYTEAELLLVRALDIWKHIPEKKHLDIASISNNLAELYRRQGQYGEAELLFVQALKILTQWPTNRFPHIATFLYNLAKLYSDQERFEDAEPLYEQALKINEQVRGAEHPETAVSLNNLATHYLTQGRFEEAEPFYQRSLRIIEQRLGAEHHETATCLNNIAELYNAQKKYAEAESLLIRALTITKKHLGTEHPNTAGSLSNLASLYISQERYEEAEPLLVQALHIFEKRLGTMHPNTANCLEGLASLYITGEI